MKSGDYNLLAAKCQMTGSEIQSLWNAAAQFDETLNFRPRMISALAAKRVAPMSHSRSRLFEGMALREPRLFVDFPIRWRLDRDGRQETARAAEEISSGFPRALRARVRTCKTTSYHAVPAVIERWRGEKSVFGVTDLHYPGTRFDRRVDTSNLNDFNLLPRGTDGFQSQDSLVISAAGAVTDSHSDDHSGSNHSFAGTKLWLLWDTLEGFSHGLEDVEHCDVYDRAAFDLPAFLAMTSSRWILVGPGQTVFISANQTHKVITLEKYLGLGNFFAGFPGFVDLLIRWQQLKPKWAAAGTGPYSVEFITRLAIRRLRSLRKASRSERHRWGLPYLKKRLRRADSDLDAMRQGAMLGGNANLAAFIRAAQRMV